MHYELRTKSGVQESIVRLEHNDHTTFVVYEPGNGTRYRLLLVRMSQFSEEARDVLGLGKTQGYVLAFPDSHYRTLTYSAGSYLAPLWFSNRVGCSLADAVVLCELLAHLTDCQAQTCEEFQKEYGDG